MTPFWRSHHPPHTLHILLCTADEDITPPPLNLPPFRYATVGPGRYHRPTSYISPLPPFTMLQLDQDRDGAVKGADCFAAFLQWGLDKTVLAQIWDLVAGNAGHLNGPQFCQALQLMEVARRAGGKLPPPSLQAPQQYQPQQFAGGAGPGGGGGGAAHWTLQSQFGDKATGVAVPAALPVTPPMPARYDYISAAGGGGAAAAGASPPSKVPAPPAAAFDDIETAR